VTQRMKVYPGTEIGFGTIARTMLVRYRVRAVLGLVLIASQAFFYNGISFTYPMVLHRYYGVPPDRTGLFVLCFALSNFFGPLLLGHFFDTVGRRKMISSTYAISGVVIIAAEFLFLQGRLTAGTQTLFWAVTFFFASAAASAGYLTVSEIFPLEMRALAIALFYAVGTAIGGLAAPALFGHLLDTHRREMIFYGYVAGGALMLLAAAVEWVLGIDTERRSLEDVTTPLTAEGPAPIEADLHPDAGHRAPPAPARGRQLQARVR
jgi:MFS family permease